MEIAQLRKSTYHNQQSIYLCDTRNMSQIWQSEHTLLEPK